MSSRLAHKLARSLAILALTACVGCDNSIEPPDGGPRDAGLSEPPPAPRLDPVASPIPWPLATVRGRANDARRVVVRGGLNPIAATVLPDNTFCVDIALPSPDAYLLDVAAQNMDGVFSTTTSSAEVVFDPGAPPISGLTTCNGMDPTGCAGAVEICDNGRDDDCNGRVDGRDAACATCVEDVLEPNDDVDAPRLDPGRYEALALCPDNEDWYAVYANAGDQNRGAHLFQRGRRRPRPRAHRHRPRDRGREQHVHDG